jgi:hypothetical protein
MNRLRQDSQDYVQTDEYVEYVRRAQQVPDEQETPTPDLSNFVGPRDPSTHPSAPQQLKDPSVRQQLDPGWKEAYLKANPLSFEQEEQMNQAQQERQARQARNAEQMEQDYQARQARQARQAEAVSLGFAPEGQPLRVALDAEFEDSLEAGTGLSFYEGRASTPPPLFSVSSGDIYTPSPIQSPFIDFRSLNQQNMAGVSGTSVPMGAAIGRGGKRAPPGSQSVSLLPRQGSSARKSLNLDLPATKVDQQFQDLFDVD